MDLTLLWNVIEAAGRLMPSAVNTLRVFHISAGCVALVSM